ncbi:MAG TPA: hypothetical protein ENF73_07115, partial [Proteobacteria bacterium]|nr:hypothetical protein [Pseudomonadota bacterium]
MSRERQESLPDEDKERLLLILEEEGRTKWLKRWKDHMAIPDSLDVLSEDGSKREEIMRYLLLRVLINQQAKAEIVREMSVRISEEFADTLFSEPFKVSESRLFEAFRDVAGERGSSLYRVGALGGIKPISLFAYRFKAYEGFIRWLNENSSKLVDIVAKRLQEGGAIGLHDFLKAHPVLEAGWVG